MARCKAAIVACALMAVGSSTLGQELEPRAYSNLPVGLNFLVAGYAYSAGSVETDPSVPIQNAHLIAQGPVLAYSRALDVAGKSAKLDLALPSVSILGRADVAGVPQERKIAGLTDPSLRFTVNFYGAPALSLSEFGRYKQNLIIGASLQISAPLGQYDPHRLVNIGTNRWAFKPQIGLSKKSGAYILELTAASTFFTDNNNFFGGMTRKEAPIYSFQGHVIYNLPAGRWVALDATYYTGGQTTDNGISNDDGLSNGRLGLTVGFPINHLNALKLYASTGVVARTGTDFNTVGVAWQYRWGGGLK